MKIKNMISNYIEYMIYDEHLGTYHLQLRKGYKLAFNKLDRIKVTNLSTLIAVLNKGVYEKK